MAQLKTENQELKQKERDFGKLHGALLDIEHSFKLLQDEKIRLERDNKDREDILQNKIDNLQNDIKRINVILEEKHKQLKDTDTQLIHCKETLEERNKELAKSKKDFLKTSEEYNRVAEDKKAIEIDLSIALENKNAAQIEIDRLIELNEKLTNQYKDLDAKDKEIIAENINLCRDIANLSDQKGLLQTQLQSRENELDSIKQSKKAIERELEETKLQNIKTEEEKLELVQKLEELHGEFKKLQADMTDTFAIVDAKEEELKVMQKNLNNSEEKNISLEQKLILITKEKEQYQLLSEEYKDELMTQQKLKEEEKAKKYELEQEKKRIEREAITKDLEARTAKRELEKLHDHKEKLQEENIQVSQELEALKQHATLLETQNSSVKFDILYKFI